MNKTILTWSNCFLKFLLGRGRSCYCLLIILLTTVAACFVSQLEIDQSNKSMTAQFEQYTQVYDRLKDEFSNVETMLVGISHPQLLSAEGLSFLNQITESVEKIPGVHHAYSLTTVTKVALGAGGAEEIKLVSRPFDRKGLREEVKDSLKLHPQYRNWLISADEKSAGIIVEIENREEDDKYRGEIIKRLRELRETHSTTEVSLYLAGLTVQKNDVGESVRRDQKIIFPISILVISLVLALIFRSIVGVILPLIVTGISILWTLGAYSFCGYSLNIITALLPPVVIVLSMATSVHVIHGWLAEEGNFQTNSARIIKVVQTLFLPCFFTAGTTALGFMTLTTSDTPAVQQFGIFSALGVVVAFIIGITLVPVCLSVISAPVSVSNNSNDHSGIINGLLQTCARISIKSPYRWLIIALMLTVLGIYGMTKIQNNTDLVKFLKPSAALYQDTMYLDEHLTGSNLLEIMISSQDQRPLKSLEDLKTIAEFQKNVTSLKGVSSVISISDIVKSLHSNLINIDKATLPENEKLLAQTFSLIEHSKDQKLLRVLMTEDFRIARIQIRIRSMGSRSSQELFDKIEDVSRDTFGTRYLVEKTGSFYLMVTESNRLVLTQLKGFGLALILVMLAIGALFWSFKLMLIALIPNLIPILIGGGLMGYLGIDLSTGTAMIASVVLGMAVDDTIHYLARFKNEYRLGRDQAILRTTTGTGRALFVTTVVLVLGFWIGCLGSFRPTIYFSLLTGITLVAALVCDLLVLPACLHLTLSEEE